MKATRLCLGAALLAVAAAAPAAFAGPTPLVTVEAQCQDPWTPIAQVGEDWVCLYSDAFVAVFVDGSPCEYATLEAGAAGVRVCIR